MNAFIEQFKKKPAAQAAGNWQLAASQSVSPTPEPPRTQRSTEEGGTAVSTQHSAFSPGGGIHSVRENQNPEPQRAQRNAEEGEAEPGAVDGLSDYQRENCVLTRDGRVVERIQMEYEVEHRLRNKLGVPPEWAKEEDKIAWHRRQLALLQKAGEAPRCEHIFTEGTTCQSPRMKKHKYCYAHARMHEVRPKKLKLLPMEDENSIMMNIMEIGRALADDEISEKKAGLLLYAQQLGLIAVRGLTFRETDGERMVRAMPKSTNLTTDDTDSTDQKLPGMPRLPKSPELKTPNLNTIPRMGADERGSRQESSRELTRKDAKEEKLPEMPKVAKIGEIERQNHTTDDTDDTDQNGEPRRDTENRVIGSSGDRVIGNPKTIPGDESAKSNVFGDEGGGVLARESAPIG